MAFGILFHQFPCRNGDLPGLGDDGLALACEGFVLPGLLIHAPWLMVIWLCGSTSVGAGRDTNAHHFYALLLTVSSFDLSGLPRSPLMGRHIGLHLQRGEDRSMQPTTAAVRPLDVNGTFIGIEGADHNAAPANECPSRPCGSKTKSRSRGPVRGSAHDGQGCALSKNPLSCQCHISMGEARRFTCTHKHSRACLCASQAHQQYLARTRFCHFRLNEYLAPTF